MSKQPPSICRSIGLALLWAGLTAGLLPLTAQDTKGPPTSSEEKSPSSSTRSDNKSGKDSKGFIRLPDGTWLWNGNEGNGDLVSLPWKEYQKLISELEQLRKQNQVRKPVTPSLCAIRVRIERRGEASVAAIRLSHTFRTTSSQTMVFLGGRKGLLASASLDGVRLPILDNSEEGYLATVETPGEHTVVMDLEAPISTRGVKGEMGFEIGLPRAAITTLQLETAGWDIPRVHLTTRLSDPSQPSRPPEIRRLNAVDVRQLAATQAHGNGYPLGPIESLEIAWDPPTNNPAADRLLTADWDIVVQFSETTVETTAKATLRGTARQWRLAAPVQALLQAERSPAVTDLGPALPPTIQRAGNKPEWLIDFPSGSAPSEWILTVTVRTPRPRPEDPSYRGPYLIGPLAVLNVFRQTGTVRLVAGPYTRFAVRHGPEVRRQDAPPTPDEDRSTASFRFASGPVGSTPPTQPLLTVEVHPLRGHLVVSPHYQLTLRPQGWYIETKLKLEPVRREADSLPLAVPPEWRGLEAGPPELVEGIEGDAPSPGGFWRSLAMRVGADPRLPLIIRLANPVKQPVTLTLTATLPLATDVRSMLIPLPRFPGAIVAQTQINVVVPEDLEVQGRFWEWSGLRAAAVATPLKPASRSAAQETPAPQLRLDTSQPVAAVELQWRPYRPPLTVDSRIEAILTERQILLQQTLRVRSNESLPQSLTIQGPDFAVGLSSQPLLERIGQGQWRWMLPLDSHEATLKLQYALPRSAPAGTHTLALFHLNDAANGNHVIRLWSAAPSPESVTIRSPVWRELPLEALPDRPVWPLRLLQAPCSESQLQLETQPREDIALTVWAERGLIQVWMGEDQMIRYRARVRLRRWHARALLLQLPADISLAAEFYLDSRRVEPNATQTQENGTFVYQLPLPEYHSTPLLLDIKYVSTDTGTWHTNLHPPHLRQCGWDGPLLWRISIQSNRLLPWLTGPVEPQWRWGWDRRGLDLIAPPTIELEQWLYNGSNTESEPSWEQHNAPTDTLTLAVRQAVPVPFRLWKLPRWPLTIVNSLLIFGVLMLLLRLSAERRLLGGTAVLTAIGLGLSLAPYGTLQWLLSGQWGLYAVTVAGLTLAMLQHLRERRIRRLPGFRRDIVSATHLSESKPSLPSTGSRRLPLPANGAPSARPGSPAATPSSS